MKEIEIKTPGTCGEYIQGWYKDNPCLVSCPMDLYSRIFIKEGKRQWGTLKTKTEKLIHHFFDCYHLPESEKEHFDVTLFTEIPLGKGMASSTADIAGMATGLSAYFELNLSPEEIGRLCTDIEPSDNLMFPKLNLFNHINGEVLEGFSSTLEAAVLMIDFYGGINTLTFNERKEDYSKEDLEIFSEIVNQFKKGLKTNNLKRVGEACTRSALLNQKRLTKRYLEKIIDLTDEFKGLGTVIGHSGTVIGVIYEEKSFEKKAFLELFKKEIPKQAYEKIREQHLIPGGIELIVKN